jgi:hypothetical protein
MPELSFRIGEAAPVPYAAVPTIAAPLHVRNHAPQMPVQSILLNCQVQVEPLGRSYSAAEETRLLDLFGDRSRWGRTMKPMLWTNQVLKVPGFSEETQVDLLLPCTMDFEVAATKYFYGLEAGNIRVSVLFSGTVFYRAQDGLLQAGQIPWDREAGFQISVAVWRQAIDAHYADTAWLRLQKETFDRLYRLKVARGVPSWDAMLLRLMDGVENTESEQRQAVAAESEP